MSHRLNECLRHLELDAIETIEVYAWEQSPQKLVCLNCTVCDIPLNIDITTELEELLGPISLESSNEERLDWVCRYRNVMIAAQMPGRISEKGARWGKRITPTTVPRAGRDAVQITRSRWAHDVRTKIMSLTGGAVATSALGVYVLELVRIRQTVDVGLLAGAAAGVCFGGYFVVRGILS